MRFKGENYEKGNVYSDGSIAGGDKHSLTYNYEKSSLLLLGLGVVMLRRKRCFFSKNHLTLLFCFVSITYNGAVSTGPSTGYKRSWFRGVRTNAYIQRLQSCFQERLSLLYPAPFFILDPFPKFTIDDL